MDDNIRINLITFACTALLTWFVKSTYDKIFRVKPRLYISINKILYSQRNNQYVNFEFTWTCPVVIKNNSKFTAENLEFIFPKNHNISAVPSKNLLAVNNHLETYKDLSIETNLTKTVPYEDVVETYMEDGTRVSLPGTKMDKPAEFFKPNSLINISIILKYKSESNKTFYTLYKKKGDKESNTLYSFNPLKIRWFLKLE